VIVPFRFVGHVHRIPGLSVEEKLVVPDLSELGVGSVASHSRCTVGCQGEESLLSQLMNPDRDVSVECIVESSDDRPCSSRIC